MHLAAGQGHLPVVEVLIRSNADINAVAKVSQYIANKLIRGSVTLMFLFMFWYSETIQCLLQVLSLLISLIINCITTDHLIIA